MANGVPIVGQTFGRDVGNMLAGGQRDPLEMIRQVQAIRNTQAEYQARLDIGQILSTSQNPQEAQNRIAQSPAFAFAPEVGPAYAHMQQSMVATAGQRDDQYNNAMDRLIKYSSNIRTAAATNDPDQINGAIDDVRQRYLAGINDPVVRARSAGAFEDYITAIKHGAVRADGSYDGGKLATNVDGQMLPFVQPEQWQAMRGYHYVTPGGIPVPGVGGALPPGQGVATGFGGPLPPPAPGDPYRLTPPGVPGAGAGGTTTTAPPPVTPAPTTGVKRTELPSSGADTPPPGAPPAAPPTGGAGALGPPSAAAAPGGAMPLGPSPPTGSPPAGAPPTGAPPPPPSAPPAAPAAAAPAAPPTTPPTVPTPPSPAATGETDAQRQARSNALIQQGYRGLAYDGRPLFTRENFANLPPPQQRGAGGAVTWNPGAEALMDGFVHGDHGAYVEAQKTLEELHSMEVNLNALQRANPSMMGDAGAPNRVALAKSINTLAKVAGIPEPFPDTSTATAENITKEGNRLAMELGRTMFGQGRVAGTTVQFESKSVPGLENTYLGDRMMIENLRAVANRTMDQYKFRYRWQQLTNGDLNVPTSRSTTRTGPRLMPMRCCRNSACRKAGSRPMRRAGAICGQRSRCARLRSTMPSSLPRLCTYHWRGSEQCRHSRIGTGI